MAICVNCPMPTDPKPDEMEKFFAAHGPRIDPQDALLEALADDEREIRARLGGEKQHESRRMLFSSETRFAKIEAESIGGVAPMDATVFLSESTGHLHKSLGRGAGCPSTVPGMRVRRRAKTRSRGG
jgi:hypothetical protein